MLINKIINKYYVSILLVLLSIILEISYVTFVQGVFQKYGFIFQFSIYKYIIAKIFLLTSLYFVEKNKEFDRFIITIFVLFMLIPNLIIFQFVKGTNFLIILSILTFIILYHLFGLLRINTKLIVPIFKKRSRLFVILLVTVLFLVPFFINFGIGINIKAFYLKNMYALRENSIQKVNIFTAYFYPWLVKVILPIGMIITLRYKKYILTVLFVIFQIYLYSIQPQKSVFVSIFLLFFYFFSNQEKQLRFLLFFLFSIIFISELIFFSTGNSILQSIFSRRVFFVPAILNNCYFDFFKDQHLYLSHSIFKHFIIYPFDLSPDHIIGKVYFGQPKMASNNGFISDGYMNFGILGVFLNIIGLIFILKIVKSLKISHIYYGVVLILIFAFISSYFLTTLLTHGVILFIFISFFILKNTALEKK